MFLLYNQSAISLSGQLDLFKEYIGKLKGLVGENRTNFILANSLYVVVFGSNDISNTYFLSRIRQRQYDVPTYTDLLVNSASNFLKVCVSLISAKIAQAYIYHKKWKFPFSILLMNNNWEFTNFNTWSMYVKYTILSTIWILIFFL